MNLKFLQLPENERKLYIDQAAIQRNVSPIVFEKDFWVCWLLGILFRSEFADHIVFKGGTSLSKVYGVIARSKWSSDLLQISSRPECTQYNLGSLKYCQKPLTTGLVKSPPSNWNVRSGKKRPFCIPNITAPPRNPRQTVSRDITPIPLHLQRTLSPHKLFAVMI